MSAEQKEETRDESLTGSNCAKAFTICVRNWSSLDRYRTPSAVDMRVFNSEQPSRTHFWFVCKNERKPLDRSSNIPCCAAYPRTYD